MIFVNIAMVLPEQVAKKHYFLEELTDPYILWGIRGIFIAGAVIAWLIYRSMKRKGE